MMFQNNIIPAFVSMFVKLKKDIGKTLFLYVLKDKF